MFRVRENPVFDIGTGEFISCDGESFIEDFPVKCDRAIANAAKSNAQTAGSTAGQFGAQGQQISSSIVPGLERDATTPTGFTAQQKQDALTSGAESTGGANAAADATARLTATRTGNAGGFADALQNVARSRMQANSGNSRDVNLASADLANKKQQEARSALAGLYGVDTSNQLKAMGVQNEDIDSELKAKQQGWLQNTEGVLNTIENGAKAAGSMGIGFGAGQTSPGDVPGQL